jgi:hypothetical protein
LIISTTALHELGHSLNADLYDCNYKAVIYDSGNNPYTDVTCKNPVDEVLLVPGAIFLPIIFASLLLLSSKRLIKNLALLIYGYSLIIPLHDYKLFISDSIIFTVLTFAGVLILLAVYNIVQIYLKDYNTKVRRYKKRYEPYM